MYAREAPHQLAIKTSGSISPGLNGSGADRLGLTLDPLAFYFCGPNILIFNGFATGPVHPRGGGTYGED